MNPKHISINIRHPLVDYWELKQEQAKPLQAAFPTAAITICKSTAEFESILPEADVCMVWNFRQEWFAKASHLRVVSTPAAGKDYFHVTPPATVEMMYGGYHGRIIAESVCGMLLGMCRGLIPAVTKFACDEWPREALFPYQKSLHGTNVAILGFGKIGQRIGRLLKPFGVRIFGMRRSIEMRPEWLDENDVLFTPAELDDLLPQIDHIILALPRSSETDNLLDMRRLSIVKPGATLINIGRGNAIDEEALCAVLKSGRLSGAFLDVFKEEPLPMDSPLRNCPNLWRLPHASAVAPDYLDLYVAELIPRLKKL